MSRQKQRLRIRSRKNYSWHQIPGKVTFKSNMEQIRWWIISKIPNQQSMEDFQYDREYVLGLGSSFGI